MHAMMTSMVCLTIVTCMSTVYAADGFAGAGSGTTGGTGGETVTVDNAADFIRYVEDTDQDPYIIYVSGRIDLGSSNIRVRGNKTLIGLPGSHVTGNLKCFRSEESNNIFRYLDMDNKNKAGDGDCITLDGVSNIWIDHCTFTDGGDGCVDIKNGADYITVSWCKFQYTYDSGHNFTNLVGHSDSNGDTDRGHLRVTFHHNWYSTLCKERMPRVRFGQVHVYNNYFGNDRLEGGYCIGVGVESHLRVENNYFDTVPTPWKDYYTGNGADGEIGWNAGNAFNACDIPIWADNHYATIFTPPYSYTLNDAAHIPALVQWGAGADGKAGSPPHWAFGPYGDFDLNGFVDVNDLGTFAGYWLDTNDLDDADYDDSGRVDLTEFALFTGNYLYTPPVPPDTTAPDAPDDLWALGQNGQVVLDWADNNTEADFAGYTIYRSLSAGSYDAHDQLNESPLTASEYTDETAANGTLYYYAVTAVDTSDNKSAYSVEACAVPDASADSIMIQETATGFCGSAADIEGIESEHGGFTGSGYANTYNETGAGIDYSIRILTAGTYTFTFRYAGITDRPADLRVDGVLVATGIPFASTGDWANWAEESVQAELTEGVKSLRLEATGSSGCANIDSLQIAGPGPAIAVCP